MKVIWEAFLKVLASFARKVKPPDPLRCEFCGAQGHTLDDCPNAAKFKLFHHDHDE